MKTRTMAALIAACLAVGLGGCADFYRHGYVGGDAGRRSLMTRSHPAPLR
jgi:acyl-CoA hydrolase